MMVLSVSMMVLSVSMMVLSVSMMVLSVSMMVLQLGLSKARGRADLVVTVVVTVVTARRKRRARRLKGKARRERRGRCRRRCRIAAEVSHTQRSSRQGTHGMTEVSHTQRSSRQGMYLTEHSTTHSTQSGGGRPRRRTVVGCLAVLRAVEAWTRRMRCSIRCEAWRESVINRG